ncbi:MAG: hypothetical protein AAFR04_04700 [Pseudomonadota bacterium]
MAAARPSEDQTVNGVLAVWNNCAPGANEAYERWYRTEHLPERMGIAGFLEGRRYIHMDGANAPASALRPRYFTWYALTSAAVLERAAYQARIEAPTPQTTYIMRDVFKDMIRAAMVRTVHREGPLGGFAVVARAGSGEAAARLDALFDVIAGRDEVCAAALWRHAHAVPEGAPPTSARRRPSAEERLRGGDRTVAAAALFETLSAPEATALIRAIERLIEGAAQGAADGPPAANLDSDPAPRDTSDCRVDGYQLMCRAGPAQP